MSVSFETVQLNKTARWLAAAAGKGAALENCGAMCRDCAFRLQPDVNGYSRIVQEAAAALLQGGAMNCHTADYQNAGVPCRGFGYAKAYFQSLESENLM